MTWVKKKKGKKENVTKLMRMKECAAKVERKGVQVGRARRGKNERGGEKGGAAAITEETRKWYRMETPGWEPLIAETWVRSNRQTP
jgi:hypothetical protein